MCPKATDGELSVRQVFRVADNVIAKLIAKLPHVRAEFRTPSANQNLAIFQTWTSRIRSLGTIFVRTRPL
jgi:hypothetical protein